MVDVASANMSSSATIANNTNNSPHSRRRSFQWWPFGASAASASASAGSARYRFQFRSDNLLDTLLDIATWSVEKFVLILGPILIVFASTIIYGLSWTFFTILLPMIQHKHAQNPWGPWIVCGHVAIVLFFLVQICFNYYHCVRTGNQGANYDRVVRELAKATDFVLPETPSQVETFRRDHHARMAIRVQRRQQRSMAATMMPKAPVRADNEERPLLPLTQPTTQHSVDSMTGGGTSPPIVAVDTNGKNGNMETVVVDAATNLSKKQSDSTRTTVGAGVMAAESSSATVKIRRTAAGHNNHKSNKQQQQRQQLPSSPSSPQQLRSWMIMAPDEWGYCERSKQPKPPRAHYDHVTRTLVLCLDHYCPWMFNAIGYFNYRYFCNFLWFVELGMMYGMILAYEPFQNSTGPLYKQQVQEFRRTGEWKRLSSQMVPTNPERLPISLAFMLCLAVGIAVACLGGFHLYLCLSAQTTIEFHGNFVNRRKARRLNPNKPWINPYSLGWRRNFQQIYGYSQPVWRAILIPSNREPEFLPVPIPGDAGKRAKYSNSNSNNSSKPGMLEMEIEGKEGDHGAEIV